MRLEIFKKHHNVNVIKNLSAYDRATCIKFMPMESKRMLEVGLPDRSYPEWVMVRLKERVALKSFFESSKEVG